MPASAVSVPTQREVNSITKKLTPDVVRIRFSESKDYAGDPALYFRVLLADESAQGPEKRNRLMSKVRYALTTGLSLEELEETVVFRCRTVGEQLADPNPDWD